MNDSIAHIGGMSAPLVAEYERIRGRELAFTAEGAGYGLIVLRGVAAWMQVAQPCAEGLQAGIRRIEAPPLPNEGELVRLLASLVLSGTTAPSTIERGFHAKRL